MSRGKTIIIPNPSRVVQLVQTSGRGRRKHRTTASATVSGDCVNQRASKHYVFVRRALSTAPVEVKLGRTTTTLVEITEGLAAGDEVLMAPDERSQASLPNPAATQPVAPPMAPAVGLSGQGLRG